MKSTIFTLALTLCLSLPASAKTYTVTNTNDSGPGSLRAALSLAANGDRIKFSVTGTITLTSAQLEIATNVTINGPGAAKLAISGNNLFPVFQVNSGVTAATIAGVTIEGGSSDSAPGGGGINNQGTLTVSRSILSGNTENAPGGIGGDNGGAINNQGKLTLSYSTLTGNGANGDGGAGGAVYNSGTLTVSHSTLSDNSSSGQGGGIYNSGMLTLDDSSVSGNGTLLPGAYGGGISNYGTLVVSNSSISTNGSHDGGEGAGIYNAGTLTVSNSNVSDNYGFSSPGAGILNEVGATATVSNSTLSGNFADDDGPGAIGNGGTLVVINTTFSGNTASGGGFGGAISNGGTLILSNSTFSENSGSKGGAIYNGGKLMLKNTLFAGQTSGGNCYNSASGTVTSDGYNLSDDATCTFLTSTGDQNNSTTAGLSPSGLKYNGGPTQTIALLSTSSAVDAIPPGACTDALGNPVSTDQRGVARPQGSGCDIGAYEFVPFVSPTNLDFKQVAIGQTATKIVTLTNSGETAVTIGPISFTNLVGNSTDFSFQNSCGPTLSTGDSCTVAVTFSPSKYEKQTVMLNIMTSAPGSALQVPITATGIQ